MALASCPNIFSRRKSCCWPKIGCVLARKFRGGGWLQPPTGRPPPPPPSIVRLSPRYTVFRQSFTPHLRALLHEHGLNSTSNDNFFIFSYCWIIQTHSVSEASSYFALKKKKKKRPSFVDEIKLASTSNRKIHTLRLVGCGVTIDKAISRVTAPLGTRLSVPVFRLVKHFPAFGCAFIKICQSTNNSCEH